MKLRFIMIVLLGVSVFAANEIIGTIWIDVKPPRLYILETIDGPTPGYRSASLPENPDIVLQENVGDPDRGASLWIGLNPTIGVQNGEWTCRTHTDTPGKLVVGDSQDNILFADYLPKKTEDGNWIVLWPQAEYAVQAMLDAGDDGTVSVGGSAHDTTASLKGFRDLWAWGVEFSDLKMPSAP
jgi:hypothetical protein